MRFPKLIVDLDIYYTELKKLIIDDNCHIFLDTNIISQMYRLNTSARAELYTWLDRINSIKKVHVPNWAIHEYSNRFLSEKTSDYLGELDILQKQLPKTLEQVLSFLKMYVDEKVIANDSQYFTDKEQLFKDFEEVISKVKIFGNTLDKKKISGLKQTVHQEMVNKFQDFSLDVNVYKLLEDIGFYQALRYESKVPPGFKDGSKEYNSVGDLLLWQEILSFCSNETQKIHKAVLVTRDMKPDFVYKPSRIIESGIEKSNNQNFKIADERLVYEFKTKTSSNEFYIINFEQLVKILSSICPTSYRELSIAVQINPETINVNEDDHGSEIEITSEDESEHNPTHIVDRSLEQTSTSVLQTAEVSTPETTTEDPYSYDALTDRNFEMVEENRIHKIIKQLKAHNWTIQNNGIDEFSSFIRDSIIENNTTNKNSLFVLGRNIYQAACGNAFHAISFIENINEKLSKLDTFSAKALLDGCLYEVYFNNCNGYRCDGCKGDYIVPLRKCLMKEDYRPSLDFIRFRLEQLPPDCVYFTPLHSDIVNVELVGLASENPDGTEVLSVQYFNVNGRRIDYSLYSYNFFSAISISTFKKAFSRVFAIPEDLIAIESVSQDVIINFQTQLNIGILPSL